MLTFPEAIYKGNSVRKGFNIKRGSELYVFDKKDIVRVGIKRRIGCKEYILKKEFKPETEGQTSINIEFTPKETQNIPTCRAILEVEIEYNDGAGIQTVYQKEIELKGVVLDE